MDIFFSAGECYPIPVLSNKLHTAHALPYAAIDYPISEPQCVSWWAPYECNFDGPDYSRGCECCGHPLGAFDSWESPETKAFVCRMCEDWISYCQTCAEVQVDVEHTGRCYDCGGVLGSEPPEHA